MRVGKSEDEAALVAALFEGVLEAPLWATFLDCLKRMTAADYAILIFRPPGRRLAEGLHLLSGDALPSDIEQVFRKYSSLMEMPAAEILAEGRPHSLEELFGLGGTSGAGFLR